MTAAEWVADLAAASVVDSAADLAAVSVAAWVADWAAEWVVVWVADMEWVKVSTDLNTGWEVLSCDLVDETCPWRHDSNKLAAALLKLLRDRTRIPIL